MLGVLEIDEVSPLEPEHPDPVELGHRARIVVLLDAGINASPAADASGKLKAITPKGMRDSLLGADLKFLSVFLVVPVLQLGDDLLLFFRGHFPKMLLKEILLLLFRTVG